MPYSLESRTGTTPVQYKSPCTAQATEPPPNVPVSVYAAFSSQHSNPDSRDNMAAGNRGAGHFASMSLPLGSTNFSMAMPNSKSSNLMMSGANPGPHNSHSTGNNNNNSSTSGRLVKSILVPQGSSATSPIRRAPTRSKSVHFEQTVAGGGVSEKSGSVQIARIKQRHAGGDHRGSSNASGDASSTQQGSGPGGGEGDNDRPSLQDLIGKDLLDEVGAWSPRYTSTCVWLSTQLPVVPAYLLATLLCDPIANVGCGHVDENCPSHPAVHGQHVIPACARMTMHCIINIMQLALHAPCSTDGAHERAPVPPCKCSRRWD
jgi:hypothetical protein